ncbi:MAG: DUF2703 domain-containing protein [Candidatus Kapabacteria bacterium]|jgi:hypothetical protein|nr:DUF2703 domain-containing protein [Candidatus Kapabacteria bacterium]
MKNEVNNPEKLSVVVQYFDGCPHSVEMMENAKIAVSGLKNIEYSEVEITGPAEAVRHRFRGSPTLLINNVDFESMPAPKVPNLACRFYSDGVPSTEKIKNKILEIQAELR